MAKFRYNLIVVFSSALTVVRSANYARKNNLSIKSGNPTVSSASCQ